jgi:hypothetical protein
MMDCFTGHFGGFATVVMIVTLAYTALFIIARMLEIQKLEQVAKAELQEAMVGGFAVIMISYVIFTLSQPIGFAMIQDFIPNSEYASYVGSASAFSSLSPGTSCETDTKTNFFFNQSTILNNKIAGAFSFIFMSVYESSNNASIASRSFLSRGIAGSQPVGGSNTEGKASADWGAASATGSMTTYFCKPLALIPAMLNEVSASASRMMSLMAAQNVLIDFAQDIYLSLFLVGIILRSINVTRGIGAFFIGFSIALYLYPIFVILMEGYVIEFYANDMGMDLLGLTTPDDMGDKITDISYFDPYEEIVLIAPANPDYTYCKENKVQENLKDDVTKFQTEIVNGVNGKTDSSSQPNVVTIGALMLSLFLAQGFSLLIVVSLTSGISKILGGDVGIWVISQITRIGV